MAAEPQTQATRRERLEEREQAILEAAEQEFIEQGRQGAKMASIAQRAGVAEGTLYLYFKNKDALAQAVVGKFYERLTAGAAEGVQKHSGSQDRLQFLVRHHFRRCLAEWPVLELAIPELWNVRHYRDSEFIGFNRAYVAIFDGVVREGIHRGEIRKDIPLPLMRDLFYGSLDYALRTHLLHQRAADAAQVAQTADQFTSMILSALLVSTPGPGSTATDLDRIAQRLERAAERIESGLESTP